MIDLHSHTLPALCDGSQDLETSLAMARMAVADGITHLACTPHIYPGLYDNSAATIAPALEALQAQLDLAQIPLKLLIGADTHMVPDVMRGLKTGRIPTLNHSRYFLLEPSHHVPVNDFIGQVENYIHAGYIPLITHPERLTWIGEHYEEFLTVARLGAWIQITAGSITGQFGRSAKKFAEQFLRDGYVHIIATDAHGIDRRPPILSEGVKAAALIVGEQEARYCVWERPQAILENLAPHLVPTIPALQANTSKTPLRSAANDANRQKSFLQRLFGRS
ncbi:tyrosine-protein phosphatase [Thiofilum flexile]|uniref:tyrosine-protein phosphatase n=1 Tax=Thiofilum flexile TaxID=125627 RepID=UPI0003696249|nr:CpsB/CapC family capsule biosynthesis tyrosine phosphatase [Thiofilum flexile]